eukprot:TRINITY_DN3762_c0_g2_i1.p1 TRINITY_DN3762_c0_g2~~TRINITY_DN3762_c0_g2_i1.p1  ORF type:complete len:196 (-),score=34.74 TRINITY_DN3762_c0_g2_i1:601-1188(-)
MKSILLFNILPWVLISFLLWNYYEKRSEYIQKSHLLKEEEFIFTQYHACEEGKTSGNNNEKELEDNEILVVTVYSAHAKQSPDLRLRFLINHALTDAADFLFIDNGGATGTKPPKASNVFLWDRENTCYDIGTWKLGVEHMKNQYNRTYKKFIFMNLSILGPLIPLWSDDCWLDAFCWGTGRSSKSCWDSYGLHA